MACLENKKVFGDVHSIAYKCQGKGVRTPSRRLIENLDDIPFPAYKYFNFVSVSEAMVFPGTGLYELAKQKGLVNDDYRLTDRRRTLLRKITLKNCSNGVINSCMRTQG